jgi:hypothetical protein
VTHESFDPVHPYIYKLYWYSRKGAASLNSLSVSAERVRSISVVASPRPLVKDMKSHILVLASERTTQDECASVVKVVCTGVETASSKSRLLLAPSSDLCVFKVLLDDGTELLLRSSKIDRVINWINMLALVSVECLFLCEVCYFVCVLGVQVNVRRGSTRVGR